MITICREDTNTIKAIAILLIIIGHNHILAPSRGLLFNYLYSFHVATFFILPFFYGKTDGNFGEYLVKNSMKLLVPYTSFYLIGLFYMLLRGNADLVNAIGGFFHVGGITQKDGCGIILVWFLLCFWCMNILKYYMDRSMAISTIVLFICIILSIISWPFVWNVLFKYSPLMIVRAIYYAGIGLVTLLLVSKLPHYRIISILIFVAYGVYYLYSYDDLIESIIAPFAFVSIWTLARLLKGYRIFQFIGKQSLEIYLVHIFVCNILYGLLPKTILGGTINLLLTILLSILIILIIKHFPIINKALFYKS